MCEDAAARAHSKKEGVDSPEGNVAQRARPEPNFVADTEMKNVVECINAINDICWMVADDEMKPGIAEIVVRVAVVTEVYLTKCYKNIVKEG